MESMTTIAAITISTTSTTRAGRVNMIRAGMDTGTIKQLV
jgi:hypothetical protein